MTAAAPLGRSLAIRTTRTTVSPERSARADPEGLRAWPQVAAVVAAGSSAEAEALAATPAGLEVEAEAIMAEAQLIMDQEGEVLDIYLVHLPLHQ